MPSKALNGFIAAAAMVWRICLPTTHEEHLITLVGGFRLDESYFWKRVDGSN
jgi:hypothetical protein